MGDTSTLPRDTQGQHASENSADLRVLRDLIESGKITPAIDRTYRSARPRPLSGTSRKAAPAARSSSPSDRVPAVPGRVGVMMFAAGRYAVAVMPARLALTCHSRAAAVVS